MQKELIKKVNYPLYLTLCMQRLLTLATVEDVVYQQDYFEEFQDCPDDTVGRISRDASLLFQAHYTANFFMQRKMYEEAEVACVGMLYTADVFLEDLFAVKREGHWTSLEHTPEQHAEIENMYLMALQEDMFAGLNVVLYHDGNYSLEYRLRNGKREMYDHEWIEDFQHNMLEILGM